MRVLLIEPSTRPQLSVDNEQVDYVESSSRIGICLPLLPGLLPPNTEVTVASDALSDVTEIEDLVSYDLVGVTCTGHSGQVVRAVGLGRELREVGVPSMVGRPVSTQDANSFVLILDLLATITPR